MATIRLNNTGAGSLRVLNGTTAYAWPALAGVTLEDRLISFESLPTTGSPKVTGTFQEMVVRSSVDKTLAFYYRITLLKGGEIAQGFYVDLGDPSPTATVDVEYRTDSLGSVGPRKCIFDGRGISFLFYETSPERPTPVTKTSLSHSMFIKLASDEDSGQPIEYVADRFGRITINGYRWATGVIPNSFRPKFAGRL